MARSGRPFLVPVVAAMLTVAGCGDGAEEPLSKSDYEQEMQAVFERAEQSRIEESGDSPEEQAAVMEEARDRIRDVSDDIDELSPPSQVAEAHDDFVAGMRNLADDMTPLIEAVREGDLAEAQRLLESDSYISAETKQRVASARAAFDRAGLEINEGFP